MCTHHVDSLRGSPFCSILTAILKAQLYGLVFAGAAHDVELEGFSGRPFDCAQGDFNDSQE